MSLLYPLWNTCYRAETNVQTGEVRSVEQFSFVSLGQDLENYSPDALKGSTVIWHYMTHASDVNHEHMVYLITIRFPDNSEEYVSLSPDGTIM